MTHYIYRVKYYVTGTDHRGYCSGLDANDGDGDDVSEFVTRNRKEYDLVTQISELDYKVGGCSSGGSEYCHGFGKKFTAFKILDITEIRDDDTDDDDETPEEKEPTNDNGETPEEKESTDDNDVVSDNDDTVPIKHVLLDNKRLLNQQALKRFVNLEFSSDDDDE